MISVTHNDGRSEPLINIQGAEIEEEVNGVFTLSFTSFFVDNPGYELLEEESIVDLAGQEFRMTDYKKKRLSKSVSGPHVFFDLIHHRVEGIQGGTRTAEEQAAFILDGSGWTWEVKGEIPPQLFLGAFGNSNAIQLIRLMCETLKCEVQIMPDKHLVFSKQIGKDDDFQFRSKYNIKDISRSVSTTDLFTAIKATGANGLEKEYRSDTWELYAINGKPRYADPVTNEEMVTEESLLAFAEQELGDRWIPQISIDVSVAELQEQGYEGVPGLGDRIWLIEPSMGLPFQTRVMKRKGNPFQKGKFVVTLSNVKQSFADILTETKVEIDKNAKEFRSRIEQTNKLIELEVERLGNGILEAYSRIQIESDRITSEVGRLDGDVLTANSRITQLADSVEVEVQRIDQNMGTLNTQVQINAGEISTKVSSTDYNGVEMISRINQTSTTIKMLAERIQLSGITEVAQTLHIGAPGSSGNKSLIFNNYSGIDTFGTDSMELTTFGFMHMNCETVRFDPYFGGRAAKVDLSTADEVIYGDNAPVARFG
ncbi:phage tail protein [Domibacillus enclensis]|uniref:Phage minor structural protein, N-terminal region n=1 Tax=Domibacillus enclensis TaxID=1017273 RepID=A0A1N6WKP0_9BACI|nr:phage tail protein [Domibacillus enclensis]SIQ90697.1 phage minor structural protein, N-terminal region [Domibacillus enclensis]